jgi:DNA-binding PadR family transcriptional regulator
MSEIHLGDLEQIVLLAVLRLGDKAYTAPILEEIEAQSGRRVARGALYTVLDRLETKGCLRSRLGEPLPERGGRARRYFTVTPSARSAHKDTRRAVFSVLGGIESRQIKKLQ